MLRGTLGATLSRVEKELIVEALKSSRGNMAAAAGSLGITERIMGLRVHRYGIEARRFRSSYAQKAQDAEQAPGAHAGHRGRGGSEDV